MSLHGVSCWISMLLPAGCLSDFVRVLCDSRNWVLVSLAVPEPTWDESLTWFLKLEGLLLYLHLNTRYQVCHVKTCEFCIHCGTKHLIHCDLVFCLAGWAQERANHWRAPWWCGTSTWACTATIKPRTYHWASRWWCQDWYMVLQCFAGFSFFAYRDFFVFLFFIWPLLYVREMITGCAWLCASCGSSLQVMVDWNYPLRLCLHVSDWAATTIKNCRATGSINNPKE